MISLGGVQTLSSRGPLCVSQSLLDERAKTILFAQVGPIKERFQARRGNKRRQVRILCQSVRYGCIIATLFHSRSCCVDCMFKYIEKLPFIYAYLVLYNYLDDKKLFGIPPDVLSPDKLLKTKM